MRVGVMVVSLLAAACSKGGSDEPGGNVNEAVAFATAVCEAVVARDDARYLALLASDANASEQTARANFEEVAAKIGDGARCGKLVEADQPVQRSERQKNEAHLTSLSIDVIEGDAKRRLVIGLSALTDQGRRLYGAKDGTFLLLAD